MKFSVGGRDYDFDLDTITFEEGEAVERATGLGIWEFGQGVLRGRASCVRAVIILAKQRAGEKAGWDDFKHLAMVPIATQLTTDVLDSALGAQKAITDRANDAPPKRAPAAKKRPS